MPKVTVLIASYNAAHFLPISIESALSQTFQDFGITVVDDGSTDNTKGVVQTFIDKYPHKIHYIRQENQGISVARNTGIEHSKGEYLAILDADDKWLPCRLEEGVKILDADSSVGLVHGNIIYIDNNGKETSAAERKVQFLNGYIFNNIFLRKADIASPTVLFRRICCDDIGIFDVKLSKLGCEDRDLWLRIALKYKIVHINKVLSYYRITPQSLSHKKSKMLEGRLYIIDKYCPKNDLNKHSLRNKALSKVYRDEGDRFLYQKDFINAREEYNKAIGFHPLAFWPWVNWIKTIFKIRKFNDRTV